MTESLRAEYRKQGVSASAICPGFTHDGGMYERMKTETGKRTPWFMGSTTTEKVAAATLKAILKDQPEVIVNSPPLRPVFALAQIFPRLGAACIRTGSFRFLHRVANARSAKPPAKAAA
jgi:short-subunit dehydrogenase